MANKSVGLLTIAFGADLRGFDRAMKKAQRSIKKFGTSLQRTGQNLTRNVTLPLVALGAASIRNFDIQAKAIAQVEAGLKSTGNQVGKTSQQLQQMAADLQKKTLFGDEEILKNATAQLLTFTNITGKQFDRTQEIALDLATRLDGDLKSASIMLGKALNDPVANLSALSRAGIQFSQEQKDVVKSLVETNRLADAQTIILAELEKQYGGSAEAARNTGAGALQALGMQLSDLSEEIGQKLLPMVIKLANKIKDLLDGFISLDDDTKELIITIGILVAGLGPLLLIAGQLFIAFAALFSPGGIILIGLGAIVLGFMYVLDNFEAFKERLSDWDWWKDTLVDAAKNLAVTLGEGIGKILGIENAFNPKELEKTTKKYEHEFKTFADSIKDKAKELAEALGLLFNIDVGGPSPKADTILSPFVAAPFIGPLNEVGDGIKKLTDKQIALNEATKTFENVFSSAMTSAAYSQEGFFKSFLDNLKQAIKQMLIQLAITTAIKFMFGGGTLSLKDAFGEGLKSVLNLSKIPFAQGGLVTGPVNALIGEGAGTSASNPEVVAPLDKLKGMIGGGTQQVEVYGRISGNDIFISNQRGGINRLRSV